MLPRQPSAWGLALMSEPGLETALLPVTVTVLGQAPASASVPGRGFGVGIGKKVRGQHLQWLPRRKPALFLYPL